MDNFLNILVTILASVLIIGLVIFIHEFGHFLLAKKNHIGVTEFSIGLGPKIFSRVRNHTVYSWRAIPFGGYCRMLGEEGVEITDSDIAEDIVRDEEYAFHKKSVWARLSVIAAGPVFNFLLALVLSVLLVSLVGATTSKIGGVARDYPAMEAGLRQGDIITKLDSTPVHLFADITLYFTLHEGERVNVTYERDGVEKTVLLSPRYDDLTGRYLIGITAAAREENMGVFRTLEYAFHTFTYNTGCVIKSLGMLFTGRFSLNDLSGPVGVGEVVYDIVDEVKQDTADENLWVTIFYLFVNFLNFAILISANLGIMNLLPIPGMDGGRILFLLVEAIIGRPIDKKAENIITFIGFMLLLLLMVVVFFNDIRKIFF